jgi:serine/threonine protein kinase
LTSDDANLAHLLRRHAQERPGAIAVKTPLSLGPSGEVAHASLTFGELDGRTDAVARLLRASGIGKGTRVLLALRPGEQLLVGFHGLLKVGAVPVAIDPGMGWRAALTGIARTRPEALLASDVRRRFIREAEIAARLTHPHIAGIHEVGEADGLVFIAQEYCQGGSLADWLERHPGPLAPRLAAKLVRALAQAVAHAHAHKIKFGNQPTPEMITAITATIPPNREDWISNIFL